MPIDFEKIRQDRKTSARRDTQTQRPFGYTGKWFGNVLYANVGLPSGMIWVRIGALAPYDRRDAVPVYNLKVATDAPLPVDLELIDGEQYQILGLNPLRAFSELGVRATAAAVPTRDGRYVREVVTAENFLPGRVKLSNAGGMDVTVEGFTAAGVDFATQDVTLVPTATGSKKAWIALYGDPADGLVKQALGSNHDTTDVMTRADIFSEITFPDEHVKLKAYVVENGASSISAQTQSEDIREFLDGGGGSISITDGTTTVTPATALEFDPAFIVTDLGDGVASVAGPSGGATFWGKKLVYHMTLGSDDEFDTNDTDQVGRSGLPSTGTHLYGMIVGRNSTANNRDVKMFANNDTTDSNYSSQYVNATSTTVSGARADTAAIGSAVTNAVTFPSIITFIIPLFRETNFQKSAKSSIARRDGASTQAVTETSWSWENTAAITRLIFRTATDTSFESGSQLFLWTDGEVSVGAADLDVGSVGSITVARADKVVMGDASNSDNTGVDTVENVLKLASDTLTSTATGNVDDLAIGNAPVVHLRFNNASTATLRGIAGSGVDGQICHIESVGAGNVELAHQNSGSTAANRLINFVTGINTPLAAGFGRATFVYDATTQRWKLFSHNQGAVISYTPTWTTSGTPPTMGSSTLTGSYLITGNLIFGQSTLTGGAGVNPGNGAFFFSLPTAVSFAAGSGTMRDTGTAQYNLAVVTGSSTTLALIAYNAQVTHAVPFAFGNTDAITFSFYGVAT